MKPLRLALALLLALAILSCEEEEAMSGTHEQLGWEWPGDRAADIRILVRVDAIDPAGGGVSGSVQSPSMAGFLPDPVNLSGTVVDGEESWVGKPVTLRLPRLELRDVKAGGLAGLGVIGDAICICVAPAPEDLSGDAAADWLTTMPCGD